jgi:hypothetical protein
MRRCEWVYTRSYFTNFAEIWNFPKVATGATSVRA